MDKTCVQRAVITPQEEYALIDRILAGDEALYAQLVNAYKSFAYTIAMKIVENRPEAEEVAQDAFIKAFHYLKKFNREAKFSTWLYRIIFNTAISYKRKNKLPLQSIEHQIIEYHERADHQMEKDDKSIFIAKALNKLSDADKLAVQLYYLKEFTLEEIAGMLDQNISTIKVRVHRARQRMADELRKILHEEALTL
jgi:RNA polymerase sigma-70 factor (ECF subfamily)